MKSYGLEIAEGTELKNASIETGTSYPADPNTGELFYHSTNGLSVYDGVNWRYTVLDNDDRLSVMQEVVVNKNPGAGQFSSIAAAVASITDSSVTKPYLVSVGPGVYTEPTIVFSPYIYVQCSGYDSTIIEAQTPNMHLIEGAERSTLAAATLTGATGVGYAAVHNINNSGNTNIAFQVESIRFGNNYIHGLCEKGYLSANDCFWGSTYGFEYGFIAKGLNGDGPARFLLRNCTSTGILTGVDGTGSPKEMLVVDGTQSLGNIFLVFARYSGETIDSNSIGLKVRNGGKVLGFQALLERWGTGILVENAGAAPMLDITGFDLQHNTKSLWIEHPGTYGNFDGNADRLSSFVDPSAQLSIFYNDVVSQGSVNVGPLYVGPTHSEVADVVPLISRGMQIGLLDGGELTKTTGHVVSVGAGSGYVRDGTTLKQLSWGATTVTADPNMSCYVYITPDGEAMMSTSLPNETANIILGRCIHGETETFAIDRQGALIIDQFNPSLDRFNRIAIGPLFVSGSIVTENATTARALDVSAGRYFFSVQEKTTPAAQAVEFLHVFHQTGVERTSIDTVVPNDTWDDGADLQPLTSGYYTKHALYAYGDGASTSYFLNHGTGNFETLQEAQLGSIPQSFISPDGGPAIAAIVVQEGVTNVVEIIDLRPRLNHAGPATGGTIHHGDLIGLTDDDHQQYLRKDGVGTMSGDLDLGSHDLTNVGLVDGVDVATHSGRHLPNGDDPLPLASTSVGSNPSTVNSAGVANEFARGDHTHEITGFSLDTHSHSASQVSFDQSSTYFASGTVQGVIGEISDIHKYTNEPSGFVDRTSSTISFNEATRTFTIAPTSASFVIFCRGRKFEITQSNSIVIPDTSGPHYIYFDLNGTIQRSGTFPSNLLSQMAYIGIVYWNATYQYALFVGDERHGVIMDAGTHSYLHSTAGAQYTNGLKLTINSIDGDGSSDTHGQISIANGTINDEDISFAIANGAPQTLSPTAQIPIWYRLGTGNGVWHRSTADSFPFIHSTTAGATYTKINDLSPVNRFNDTTSEWELVELSAPNNFFCVHVFGTPSIVPGPIFGIQGAAGYLTASAAGQNAAEEIESILENTTLPSPELVLLYSIVVESSSSLSNSVHARIVSPNNVTKFVNYTGVKFTKNLVTNIHGVLRGLGNDDHLQYAKTNGTSRVVMDVNSPSNGQVLQFDGTKWVNTSQSEAAAPLFKQAVSGDVPYSSGNNTIPYDNSLPLNTEGAQFMSATLTPTSLGSTIVGLMSIVVECSVNSRTGIISIFRNSTLISVIPNDLPSQNKPNTVSVLFHDQPGTTSAVTYTARFGVNTTAAWKINKNDGSAGAFAGLLQQNGYLLLEY